MWAYFFQNPTFLLTKVLREEILFAANPGLVCFQLEKVIKASGQTGQIWAGVKISAILLGILLESVFLFSHGQNQ